MEPYNTTPAGRDPHLWAIAQRRAAFKGHLISYLVINGLFWAVYYLTDGAHKGGRVPWPLFPTLGWGIGLLFHYLGAYVFPQSNRVEQEYQKLVRNGNE